jgi:tungstate transport system permease protein
MLGANIRGLTRVLTTAIALETAKGELGLSFALSFILLAVVLSLNFLVSFLQEGRLGRQGWLRLVMGER